MNERPRLLITRPEADAERLKRKLDRIGVTAVLAPVLAVRYLRDADFSLDNVTGLLFTSANGVRAFEAASDRRDIDVFAVGAATADAARDAGFGSVEQAGGDVESLARKVVETRRPDQGKLLHVAGSVSAGDLRGALEEEGFTVERAVLYRAEAVASLPETAAVLLDEAVEDGVAPIGIAFFSPRTVAVFLDLVEKSGRLDHLSGIRAFCLSEAVAAKAYKAEWAGVTVAAKPDGASLVEAVGLQFNSDYGKRSMEPSGESIGMEDETNNGVDGQEAGLDAGAVIDAFGGIRPMAHKLEIAVSTVQGWKSRGQIPESRWRDVIAAADSHGVDLSGLYTGEAKAEPSAEEQEDDDGESKEVEDAVESEGEAALTNGSSDVEEQAGAASAPSTGTAKTGSVPATSAPPERSEAATSGPRNGGSREVPPGPTVVRKAGMTGSLALFLVILLAIGMILRPYWSPWLEPRVAALVDAYIPQLQSLAGEGAPDSAERIAELDARMEALTTEVETLSDRLESVASGAGSTGQEEAIATIRNRLDTLEDGFAGLSGSLGQETGGPVDDDLAARVDALTRDLNRLADAVALGTTAPDGGPANANGDGDSSITPPPVPSVTEAEFARLEREMTNALDSLESEIGVVSATLGSRLETIQSLNEAVKSLEADLQGLRESTEAQDAALDTQNEALDSLGEQVESHAAAIDGLRNRPAVEGAANAGLVLSIGNLERALNDGDGFADSLDRIAALGEGVPEVESGVDALRPFEDGVATAAELIRRFSRNAGTFHTEATGGDGTWVEKALDGVRDLVPIRRTGGAADRPPVSRAEAAIDQGDISAALGAMEEIEGSGEAADRWIAAARKRVEAEKALRGLQDAVVEGITQAGKSEGGTQ